MFYPFVFLGLGLLGARAADPTTPNLIVDGQLTGFSEAPNPWGGANAAGNLHGLNGYQLAVDSSGTIDRYPLSPSVALGDLNGDGLIDIVLADPKGFFWFFANNGTKTEPKYTAPGEIMPIWVGEPLSAEPDLTRVLHYGTTLGGGADRTVPRIQLLATQPGKLLDLIVGTYAGRLFIIRNTGNSTRPNFATPKDLEQLQSIPMRSDSLLDCNYCSPFLYDWFGPGHFDLVRGEGTYSANSIFLFPNKGGAANPTYSEATRTRIIPGLGREHLTPQVIDWNNDGKPDIVAGERTGQIELYLNTTTDADHPTFAEGKPLVFGGLSQFGKFTTVVFGALSGNPATPDAVISNDSGELLLARNTGKPGAFEFSAPVPIKAVNPYPKINVPTAWALGGYERSKPLPFFGNSNGTPYGVPYEFLEVTNAAREKDFLPPDGTTVKNALKFSVADHKSVYFPDTYYPAKEDEYQRHLIANTQPSLEMLSDTRYQLTYWVKGSGVHDFKAEVFGVEEPPKSKESLYLPVTLDADGSVSSNWNKITASFSFPTKNGKPKSPTKMKFWFVFQGQGTLYIADIQLHQLDK